RPFLKPGERWWIATGFWMPLLTNGSHPTDGWTWSTGSAVRLRMWFRNRSPGLRFRDSGSEDKLIFFGIDLLRIHVGNRLHVFERLESLDFIAVSDDRLRIIQADSQNIRNLLVRSHVYENFLHGRRREICREIVGDIGEIFIRALGSLPRHLGNGGLPTLPVLSGGQNDVRRMALHAQPQHGLSPLAGRKFGVCVSSSVRVRGLSR